MDRFLVKLYFLNQGRYKSMLYKDFVIIFWLSKGWRSARGSHAQRVHQPCRTCWGEQKCGFFMRRSVLKLDRFWKKSYFLGKLVKNVYNHFSIQVLTQSFLFRYFSIRNISMICSNILNCQPLTSHPMPLLLSGYYCSIDLWPLLV